MGDILREVKDIQKCMTAEGSICWPPVCNPSDTKVPQNHFGENLTQFNNRNRKQFNNNQKSPVKKNGKDKNGNSNDYKNWNGSHNHQANKKKSGIRSSNKNTWNLLIRLN